jgi:hypothetical protein
MFQPGGRDMTITLPADRETERLARKLSELSGKSLTAVVHEAIAAQAAAAGVVPEGPAGKRRPGPGLGCGMITFIAPDFDAPLDPMKEYME